MASTSNPHSNLVSQFLDMGFPEATVRKVIEENGGSDKELLLEIILTYSVLNESPSESVPVLSEDDYLSDSDCCLEEEEDSNCISEREIKLKQLIDIGFALDEASLAIDAVGPDTSVTELMDFIYASQLAEVDDPLHESPRQIAIDETIKRRKLSDGHKMRKREIPRQKQREISRQKQKRSPPYEDDGTIRIPKEMIGFGVPSHPNPMAQRTLPEAAIGPPYFYYENVALTPKGVWDTISRFLFDIEPEFVDSEHFSATKRKRGYIHNLPIKNRKALLPIPPLTIQDALPLSKRWWPSWDTRTKLNCLNTCIASAKNTQRLRDALEKCHGEPPIETIKYVMHECRKWNLVWTGKNKLAPLECDEMEMLLGYPKDHTRGASRTDRYKSLGNSFQIDTVAYHFSVLKDIFPNGMNVLSLFSGIGGAEVALHRLGIPLKNVVSVEISEANRNIIRTWWDKSGQRGTLIELANIQELNPDRLAQMVQSLGGFDLIVGGSPCNNLTGSNRHHRDGLHGDHSVLFYDYFRILNMVKLLMENR